MTVARDEATVRVLREAARSYAEATSLREAAAALDMSPSGLRALMAGTQPQGRTVRKLTLWYLRTGWKAVHASEEEVVTVAMGLLAGHLSPDGRDRVRKRIVAALREETLADGQSLPLWLQGIAPPPEGTSAEGEATPAPVRRRRPGGGRRGGSR